MKPAIFLDRDGTLIKEVNYLHKPEQVEWIDGIASRISRANLLEIPCIVVTNQSGVARGLFSESDVINVHRHLNEDLSSQNAFLTAFYFCPHHPEAELKEYAIECKCRKPNPGMILKAAADYQIDIKNSFIIGDKLIDLQTGWNLNMTSILVETGYGTETLVKNELPNDLIVCSDVVVAMDYILEHYENK